MRSLNFAVLKYFTEVNEACAEDVIEALKGEYGSFKVLKRDAVIASLMTAEANGVIKKTRFELDQTGKLRLYYNTYEEGAVAINRYIKD